MLEKIMPRKIWLEASSICQLRCVQCWHSNSSSLKWSAVGIGYLKFSDFKNLVDDNPWVKEIELSNWGEIFLNPELLDIIKYAYWHDVGLTADNGVNLNDVEEEVLEGLVKYKFLSIRCSIDGASNDTYKIYRINGNYDKVIKNINIINKYKEKYQSIYPLLTWQFVLFGHNEHELAEAKNKAKELGMAFKAKVNYAPQYSPVNDSELYRREFGHLPEHEYKQKTGEIYLGETCRQLWHSPAINWDGKILGCCINQKMGFGGNAFKDGLLKCINSRNMKYAREMLMGRKRPKNCIPCSHCEFYFKLRESGNWLQPKGEIQNNNINLKNTEHLFNRLIKSFKN